MPGSIACQSTTSLLTKTQEEKLREIVTLFNKAEIDLKKSEHLDSKLNIPCINELRYAGYHIAKATSGDNPDENIEKAVGHCKRAIYDANESAVIFLLESIRSFQNDYAGSANVSTIVDGYSKLKQEISDIANRIKQNKSENSGSRDKYYESCSDDCDRLKEIENLLTISRDEINVLEAKDLKDTRRFVTTVVLGGLGIVTAIAIAALQ